MWDGAHIRTLLLTFLFRLARPLIEEGKIYVGLPPLFKIKWGKDNAEYFRTVDDMEEKVNEFKSAGKVAGKDYIISRFKGLNASPETLRSVGITHLKLEGSIDLANV